MQSPSTQQYVEKYLKAWLSEKEIYFPRTHDLEALAVLALSSLPSLSDLLVDVRFLTSFAVEIRYPGVTAEKQDAEKCFQIALRVRQLIRTAFNADTEENSL